MREYTLGVGDAADSARHAERNVEQSRDPIDPRGVERASVRTRGDVVENEFVRAVLPVARGQFEDLADGAVIAKTPALDDLIVADVEAGNYAAGKNGAISRGEIRFSRSARPQMAAATPVFASARRSAA